MPAGSTWTLDLPANLWRCRGLQPVPAVYVTPIVDGRIQWADILATSTGGAPPVGDTFVLGVTKPIPANIGQAGYAAIYGAPAAARTVVNGDVTLSTPGQVYANKQVNGYIFIRAANVTVRNCGVTARATTSVVGPGAINVDSSAASNFLVEFCDITCAVNTNMFWSEGIRHRNSVGTVRRCNIHDVGDGINCGDANGGRLRVESSYVHHLSFYNNNTNHSGDQYHPNWGHQDCVQIMGGSGHSFQGNSFEASISDTNGTINTSDWTLAKQLVYGSGVTPSPGGSQAAWAITNLLFTQNWSEYGQSGFQMNSNNNGLTAVGEVSENRFGMGQYDNGNGSRYQIRYNTGLVMKRELTNYFDPDAPTVPTPKKGQLFTVGFSGGIRRN